MTDVIRYVPSAFRERRPAAPVPELQSAIDKLNRLYATRACFVVAPSASAGAPPDEAGSHRRGRHGHGHGGRPRTTGFGSSRPQHPQARSMLKVDRLPRVERDIVATLNKVNDGNFEALRTHVLRAFAMDTDACMRLLLDRCHLQVEYMPQYVGLMQYILDNTQECNRDFVRRSLRDFVEGFIAGRSFSGLPMPDADEAYDDYCEWVRTKRMILGKHKTILRLLSEGMASDAADLHSYFCSLIATLYEEMHASAHTTEVLLDMLSEFFSAELVGCSDVRKYAREWNDAIADAYRDEAMSQALNIKCRFKLLNILEAESQARKCSKVHTRPGAGGSGRGRLLRR